jgi:predicted DCC family thiol-disulfide oxidoreductase YuxK
MRTLANHQILFDAECPMCKMYAKAIVSAGILDQDGRAAYQEVTEESCPMLDRQRAVNEIALVNQETGEVTYGIESIFKVMAAALPGLKILFTFKPFVWLMSKVYAFISYNRRVIVPPQTGTGRVQIQPAFKLNYRIAYIVIVWLAVSMILSAYAHLLVGLLPGGQVYREYVICGGQVVFQGLIMYAVDKSKAWSYLGNLMTISLAGALCLLPVLLIFKFISPEPVFCIAWFLLVAGIMFLEHIRRCKLLGLGWSMTVSWVLYGLIILLIISM